MTSGDRNGFTLIEVVGAVAIVGIWFLVLSTAAFNGLAAESAAQRLLEASLVADEALADAESQALLGLPIELESGEYGDLDFDGVAEYVVVVENEPFDPLSQLVPSQAFQRGSPFVDPAATSAAPGAGLISMERIRIDVYHEADLERDDEFLQPLASRTTFAIDAASLALLGAGDDAGAALEAIGDENGPEPGTSNALDEPL